MTKTETLRAVVEMVANSNVRFIPRQPSFGRKTDTVKVTAGNRADAAEMAHWVNDALHALGQPRQAFKVDRVFGGSDVGGAFHKFVVTFG